MTHDPRLAVLASFLVTIGLNATGCARKAVEPARAPQAIDEPLYAGPGTYDYPSGQIRFPLIGGTPAFKGTGASLPVGEERSAFCAILARHESDAALKLSM